MTYRTRYTFRRSQGLCAKCGIASPDKVLCYVCSEKAKEWQRKQRAKNPKGAKFIFGKNIPNCKHDITYITNQIRYCCLCNKNLGAAEE